jgi:hypothetical protein
VSESEREISKEIESQEGRRVYREDIESPEQCRNMVALQPFDCTDSTESIRTGGGGE